MTTPLETRLVENIEEFKRQGVYKRLNFLEGPQGPRVRMEGRGEVICQYPPAHNPSRPKYLAYQLRCSLC